MQNTPDHLAMQIPVWPRIREIKWNATFPLNGLDIKLKFMFKSWDTSLEMTAEPTCSGMGSVMCSSGFMHAMKWGVWYTQGTGAAQRDVFQSVLFFWKSSTSA